MASREQEWEELYDQLRDALAEFGTNDAFGNGEYWVLDDDYGGYHQKICIGDVNFWTARMEKKIRDILVKHFPRWGVFFVFERDPETPGLIIYADGNHIEPQEPRRQ
jgi:hypothetical protein